MTPMETERPLALPIERFELPAGFSLPDWNAPLDLDAVRARVPHGATVKGMFLGGVRKDAQRRGYSLAEGERFAAFDDYPMTRHIDLLAEAAAKTYSELPVREALRRLAAPAFELFANALIGRVVFAAVGQRVPAILNLAARAWSHAAKPGKLETVPVSEDASLVRVSDFYLPEPVAIGIAEGVLRATGHHGVVAVQMTTPSDGEFWIHWE